MAGHNAHSIDQLISEVFRLYGAIVAAGDAVTVQFGLSSARWQIMGAIEATASATVSDLARQVGVTRQSVQRIVTAMVAEGFLELLENPRHLRAKTVAMTERGWRAYRDVTDAWKTTAERMDQYFGPTDLVQMTQRLAELRDDFRHVADGRRRSTNINNRDRK